MYAISVLRSIHPQLTAMHGSHSLHSVCTDGFSHCKYCTVQMKHMFVYGRACTGNYLIMVMKKSQHVFNHGDEEDTACSQHVPISTVAS